MDIPWGEKGAVGFWDWEERKRPIPRDLLTQILLQKRDNQVVTSTAGRPLLVSQATRWTHAQMIEKGLRMREWDAGIMALRGSYWLPPSLVEHVLDQWANAQEHGYGERPPTRTANRVWVTTTSVFDDIRQQKPIAHPELMLIDRILMPMCNAEGDWMTGIIDLQSNRVHVEDPTGTARPERVRVLIEWISTITGTDQRDWTGSESMRHRVTARLDGGVAMIADIMCVARGLDPAIAQRGLDRFRKWIGFLLWSSGDMSIVTNNNSTVHPRDIRAQRGRLRHGMQSVPANCTVIS
mmetsp:Transcript_30050/g.61888  ORF Transcript_30050/g.61888 Transcript_30050/m.61888 type:complete len:295 (+) Transcript_30050:2218-3102(+)